MARGAIDGELKKERLEARLTLEQKEHIEQAARIRGTSVSDFVILSADEAALRTIREQQALTLNERAREAFAAALLNPPTPHRRLVSAAKRYRRWVGNKARNPELRAVDGAHLLIEAMRYLAQSDPVMNRAAIELLSEHVRRRFRLARPK